MSTDGYPAGTRKLPSEAGCCRRISKKLRDFVRHAACSRASMHTAAELNRLSHEIIAAGIAVHRRVGPGCLESAYLPCMALELCKRGLDFSREAALTLRYDDLVIPRAYLADFIVEASVVVEIKAVAAFTPRDVRQLQTYLELSGCPLGLLVNFGAVKLTDGIKRVVKNFPDSPHQYGL